MWVVTNQGLVSIVANRAKGFQGTYLVRARRKKDLLAFFDQTHPSAELEEAIQHNPDADYHYRIVAEPDTVKAALFHQVDRINYGNFKDSIGFDDLDLQRFAGETWAAGWRNLCEDEKAVAVLQGRRAEITKQAQDRLAK